jgi:putative ABC transport system permease protein
VIVKLFLVKELRKHPFFFILLSVILLLGFLGLTSIGLISEQVKFKLRSSARELLSSDIAVSARRDLLAEEIKELSQVMAKIPHRSYRVVDIYSMIRHEKTLQTRLVEIRSIEEGFPFYGEIKLEENSLALDGPYISRELAQLWSIKPGDEIKIGNSTLAVKGIVTSDSSQGLRGFSLAPRIYMPLRLVNSSGLLRPGSTGSFARHYLIKNFTPEDFQQLRNQLLRALPDNAIKVTLPEESSEQTGRVMENLTDFMSLAALIGLLLSLVGVFYLYQSHLLARLRDFCLFYLYGLEKKEILWGLVYQFTLVFMGVFGLQLILLVPAYRAALPLLSGSLGIDLSPEVNLFTILKQLPFLYLLSLSILIPLLMGILRTPMGLQLKSPRYSLGRFRFYDFSIFVIFLWAYSVYLSHSYRHGSLFFLALVLVFFTSMGIIKLLQFLFKKFLLGRGLLIANVEMGVAIRNIVRSGHKLTLSFLSLAIGSTLIALILQLDSLIQREFTINESRPALFAFDIQEDQLESLQNFALERGIVLEGITPMIRARLERINGESFKRVPDLSSARTREEEVEGRMRNRGINLTYRKSLSAAEKIVAGNPFPSPSESQEKAYISLEKRFAQRLGINLGDKLIFDVQGIEVEGEVINFREVKWTSFYPNFFVNFSPGIIDEAPKTYLAVVPQVSRELKQAFQREAVGPFSNISFIDVEELTGKLGSLFEKSRRAIEVISWFALAVGLVILYGVCHDQVYRRYYDLALMKTLGLTSGRLRLHLVLEFGFLFFVAMMVGFFLGGAMAVVIAKEVFKLNAPLDLGKFLFPGLLLSGLCLVTIIASSWRPLSAKPRELLSDS